MYADEIERESVLEGSTKVAEEASEAAEEFFPDGITQDDLPPIDYNDPDGLRRNTLYMKSHSFADLTTSGVMDKLRILDPEPLGIEWIDDESILAVYRNADEAQTSAIELTRGALPDNWIQTQEMFEAVRIPTGASEPQRDLPLDDEPKLEDSQDNMVMEWEDANAPIMVRIGRLSDRKAERAAARSRFYAEQAKKERLEHQKKYGMMFHHENKRRRRGRGGRENLLKRFHLEGPATRGRDGMWTRGRGDRGGRHRRGGRDRHGRNAKRTAPVAIDLDMELEQYHEPKSKNDLDADLASYYNGNGADETANV